MSGYGLSSWFAKLFCTVLPLARKFIALVAADFASSTLHNSGSGKDIQESVSLNLRASARSLGEQLKQLKKILKRRSQTSSLIRLKSAGKRKASKKVNKSKKDFFS
jgi:gamma-glutamyl:cysteine ligase YbdK (ATP-grasp superfamily)